eukprot:CAMPEP_0170108886 /NCGR_PEP_ID=MMETSP0020_2-20130122/6851_1 /TAXON_ID=98059 /ORGANISM="Dinobryon sp., Strain UTEXLB2267" /LENGTH=1138 /DNA_ID=CAMNT_0010333719 /DNA_START=136 /DNA_END=3552 /DNA_ORIENTATION=-
MNGSPPEGGPAHGEEMMDVRKVKSDAVNLPTEVDDGSRIYSEGDPIHHNNYHEPLRIKPQKYMSGQITGVGQSEKDDSQNHSNIVSMEKEVEWLVSVTGMTREQAIELYLTKNNSATHNNGRITSPTNGSRHNVTAYSTTKESNQVSINSSTTSPLEKIFDFSLPLDRVVEENALNHNQTPMTITKTKKYQDRDIRPRITLTNNIPQASRSSRNQEHALESSNNIDNMTKESMSNFLSESDIYEDYDNQVHAVQSQSSRKSAYPYSLQMMSQNIPPRVTQTNKIHQTQRSSNAQEQALESSNNIVYIPKENSSTAHSDSDTYNQEFYDDIYRRVRAVQPQQTATTYSLPMMPTRRSSHVQELALEPNNNVTYSENLSNDFSESDNNLDRQEFYENFDRQVHILMSQGYTREESFQLQLLSQNIDPNITPVNSSSISSDYDMEQKHRKHRLLSGGSHNQSSSSNEEVEQEIKRLMELGMTGEQALHQVKQINHPQQSSYPPTRQQTVGNMVTKVAVRSDGIVGGPEYVDNNSSDIVDEYQESVQQLMQSGFTREQAELALQMAQSQSSNASLSSRQQQQQPNSIDHPLETNKFDPSSVIGRPDQTARGAVNQLNDAEAADFLDVNDEAEIAVLMERGYTRAEAILTIMAADEAEAIGLNGKTAAELQLHQSTQQLNPHMNFMLPIQSDLPSTLPLVHQNHQQPLNFPVLQHQQFVPISATSIRGNVVPPPVRGEPADFNGNYQSNLHSNNHGNLAFSGGPVLDVSMIPSMSATFPTNNTRSLSNAHGNSSGVSVATPAVPQPSPRMGTYFKARGPDDEALEMAILLSHQESSFGINMFDSLRAEDEVTMEAYMALGFTGNDAALEIFERRYGLSPPSTFTNQLVVPSTLAYNTNVNSFTYPGRGNQGYAHGGFFNNNEIESMADIFSSHRRNVSSPTFFSNHSFQHNNGLSIADSFYPQQRFGEERVANYHSNIRSQSPARSVQSAAARYHNQRPQNTFNHQPQRYSAFPSMSSSGSVATAPTHSRSHATYNNNTRTFSSSSTATGGRSVDGGRGGIRRRYDATFSPLDEVPPYIHSYPPPESVIDTQWRQALRVDKCKKASVKRLMRMGFSEEHAVQALLETNQQEDQARQLLMRTRF